MDKLQEAAAIEDPIERIRALTASRQSYQDELMRLRTQAVHEAIANGVHGAEIARRLGRSRAWVHEMAHQKTTAA